LIFRSVSQLSKIDNVREIPPAIYYLVRRRRIMKRAALIMCAAVLCLAVLSCQKAPSTEAGVKTLTVDAKSGFMIRTGQGLYEVTEGTAKWAEAIPLGEKLALQGDTIKAAVDGKERDFTKVKRDNGAAGWVRSEYVVSRCTLAVVTGQDVVIFKEPKNATATAMTIPALAVIAVHEGAAGDAFRRVTWFDPTSFVLSAGVYIRGENLTVKADDVESMILLQLAAAATDPRQKKALLDSAVKDYPGSQFITRIEDALAPLAAAAAPRATEKFFATLVATDDAVNVRSAPDEGSGTVVGTLAKGQSVDVEEKTSEDSTIGGATAPWYRISSPAGWVFGGWLAAEE
jgi:uncharacterized protein YgiM (DUF1202 family)